MHRFSLEQVCSAINIGLIVVDADENILMWNAWMEKFSGIEQDTALQGKISTVFPEEPSSAFLSAVRQALAYGAPVVMSNVFHRAPLPLYQQPGDGETRPRLFQSIEIAPLGGGAERYCLIQVTDASASLQREKMLREHSDKLRTASVTDSLTGIYNRRFFDEHYQLSLNQAKRQGKPLSVVLVDVDYFKHYNDHYGHLAGDKALIKVAKTLQSQLSRRSDVLARFGGEEFILMLPDTNAASAAMLAEKLRSAIVRLATPHAQSSVGPVVTISAGISTYDPLRSVSAEQLLESADQALYQAKRRGRNRYVVAQAESEALPLTA